ncbi:MAG: phosphoglycerate mutase family protein [Alphaproteobacteria bacterium]|nr:phosphoglycerate mutase family protein [Alphaproteobacteria bacterium]MBP3688229.1 phosphoglycerate mutase family protein [Alphaproteobacteria bacterium]
MKNNYILQSEKQQQKALKIIQSLQLIKLWEKNGATVNQVGSVKLGLLAKHRDIDFHIYTDELNVKDSFAIISELCANPQVKKCEFTNLADTEENCFEWHLFYEDEQNELWQIDMIQIKRGSQYDGYFENVATQILQQMTPSQKEIILKLKYETPNEVKISGIEYYKAVIQDGAKTYEDLLEWRKKHPLNGIIEW